MNCSRAGIENAESCFFNRFGQLIYKEPRGKARRLPDARGRHPPRHAASRALSRRAGAHRAGLRRHQPPVHRRRAGRERRAPAVQGDDERTGAAAGRGRHRDRLRRRQFGAAPAARRRQRGVHRHQHLARRHEAQADPHRPQLHARRLDLHRQDRDLSDRRRHRRRGQPAHQLDHRDQARHGRDERLEQAGRPRRLHLGLRQLALRLARCRGADPQVRVHPRISDGRQGPARRAGPSAA